jgi:hypothetical protein
MNTSILDPLTEDQRNSLEWLLIGELTDDEIIELAQRAKIELTTEALLEYGKARCDDCKDDVGARGEWFMVHEEVWEEAGGKRFLCVRCMETRLGRPLTPRDFNDAPCNIPNMSTLLLNRLGYGPA